MDREREILLFRAATSAFAYLVALLPELTFAWACICTLVCAFVWARAFVAFVHLFAFSPSFGLALRLHFCLGCVWACACVAFALSFTFAHSFGLTLGLLLRVRLRVCTLRLSLRFCLHFHCNCLLTSVAHVNYD